MELLQIVIGQPFENDLPEEAFSIRLINGMPMIVFNFSLTQRDIQNFENGIVSLGLFEAQDVLFFLFKIEGFMDWSDLAFTIHLAGEETIEAHKFYLPFNLVLVESKSKIVMSLRVVTVSPGFRAKLANLIERQLQQPFDTINYYKQIGRIYEQYPTAFEMLKQAVIVEQGGTTLPNIAQLR